MSVNGCEWPLLEKMDLIAYNYLQDGKLLSEANSVFSITDLFCKPVIQNVKYLFSNIAPLTTTNNVNQIQNGGRVSRSKMLFCHQYSKIIS